MHRTWDKLHQVIRLDAERRLPGSRRTKERSLFILGRQLVLTDSGQGFNLELGVSAVMGLRSILTKKRGL